MQLEAIKKELGESDGSNGDKDEDELEQLGNKIEEADLSEEASTVAQRELKRLKKLQPASSEYAVARNYLELLADLPWNKKSEDVIDIKQAKQKLEDDHFGLDHVKKRIIEYLSVIKIKGDLKAPIICFVGPVSTHARRRDYKSTNQTVIIAWRGKDIAWKVHCLISWP